jgi:hypothetical protein
MLSLYWSYNLGWEWECYTVVVDAPDYKLITLIWWILFSQELFVLGAAALETYALDSRSH